MMIAAARIQLSVMRSVVFGIIDSWNSWWGGDWENCVRHVGVVIGNAQNDSHGMNLNANWLPALSMDRFATICLSIQNCMQWCQLTEQQVTRSQCL